MKKVRTTKHSLTARIEKRGKWYVGFIEEIPGVNTQGRSLHEVRESLLEALELILESNRQLIHDARSPRPVYRQPIAYLMTG